MAAITCHQAAWVAVDARNNSRDARAATRAARIIADAPVEDELYTICPGCDASIGDCQETVYYAGRNWCTKCADEIFAELAEVTTREFCRGI